MFSLNIDEKEMKKLYLERVDEYLRGIEEDVFFFTRVQLMEYLNLSWNTIQNNFLVDENFPQYKYGNKWLFPKSEVKEYMERYCKKIRAEEGNVRRLDK